MDKIPPFLTKSSHISIQMFEIRMQKTVRIQSIYFNTDCSQKIIFLTDKLEVHSTSYYWSPLSARNNAEQDEQPA